MERKKTLLRRWMPMGGRLWMGANGKSGDGNPFKASGLYVQNPVNRWYGKIMIG